MKRQPRIVVIGSANIDLVTFTDEFPRPGETIFGREFSLGFAVPTWIVYVLTCGECCIM